VVSANGLAGTVANATTTPAITLSTSVTGVLKGNGIAISAATAGTDYAPATSGSSILVGDGAGGFNSATVAPSLTFSAGILSLADGDKGDITVASGGTSWTVDANAITNTKLADMATEIEAAELLLHKAAFLKNENRKMTLNSAMCKMFASELCVRASSEAIQIHGGYGYTKDYPVEKLYRDAKLCTIGEGTTEIQKVVIAKNIL
jgi:hypothetical protein